MCDTISSGNEWNGEFCNKKKNDELYWEFVSISPILNNEGTITHYVAVKEDITERKQIEEELRISHKMMSIGRLTASVFHEILNPVNIISAHTQLLLMGAEDGSKEEEDLKSIQGEIDRIVIITDELLKFTRKEEDEVEKVGINGLLENALALLRPELNIKRIEPILKLEKGLPEVMVHGGELRQVFLNIITNALEAMPEGGSLTIETQIVQYSKSGVQSAGSKDSELKTPISKEIPQESPLQIRVVAFRKMTLSKYLSHSSVAKQK